MSGYTEEYRQKIKEYRLEMIELRKTLPTDYSIMIMNHKLKITDPVKRKRASGHLYEISRGESYKLTLEHPEYVEYLRELSDKYKFFMQIWKS